MTLRRTIDIAFAAFGFSFMALALGVALGARYGDTLIEYRERANALGLFAVVQAADGDTIRVRTLLGSRTVRLIGSDTPETRHPSASQECFGPEAAAYTARLVQGKLAQLAFDPRHGARDRHGRLVAYVYLYESYWAYLSGGKAVFLNLALIENGFAEEWAFPRAYGMQARFRAAEARARAALLGGWKACGESFKRHP